MQTYTGKGNIQLHIEEHEDTLLEVTNRLYKDESEQINIECACL